MFQTSSVHLQERFVQAVFADLVCAVIRVLLDTSSRYKVVGKGYTVPTMSRSTSYFRNFFLLGRTCPFEVHLLKYAVQNLLNYPLYARLTNLCKAA